jgi:hypothetical protein
MDVDLPRGGAEASVDLAALIPCRRIERERDMRNMMDVVLRLMGEYI